MYKKIYVEITNACNLSCDFCIKNQRELKFMSEKEFKIILEKLKNHTKYLYFHVLGEPLMHPKINEFINLASLSYKVNITTNGYLIEKIKNNKNIRQLNISLHSYNSKYNINLDDYLNHIFEVVDTLENTFISYRLWVDSSNVDKVLNKLKVLDDVGLSYVKLGQSAPTLSGGEAARVKLAKELQKNFTDTDDEIIKRINMPIADYFVKNGEESFRKLESEVIKEISACRSSVIATGGGAVLNPDNIRLLKENGTVIFIDRPLEKLVTTADRPLSSNKELLEKRFKERYGLYCAAADVKIDAVNEIEQNVKNIEEVFLNENSCN